MDRSRSRPLDFQEDTEWKKERIYELLTVFGPDDVWDTVDYQPVLKTYMSDFSWCTFYILSSSFEPAVPLHYYYHKLVPCLAYW